MEMGAGICVGDAIAKCSRTLRMLPTAEDEWLSKAVHGDRATGSSGG